jgi:uncharacterized protein YjbI with pentapeptide repeats
LTGWNFAGQDLSNACLWCATLTNVNLSNANLSSVSLSDSNLSGADLRGANYGSLTDAITHNTILADGTINGLSLAAGETLLVRNSTIPIHVIGTPSFAPAGSLRMVLGDSPWGSTISFDAGVLVPLPGELDLTLASGTNFNSLTGKRN